MNKIDQIKKKTESALYFNQMKVLKHFQKNKIFYPNWSTKDSVLVKERERKTFSLAEQMIVHATHTERKSKSNQYHPLANSWNNDNQIYLRNQL